VADVILSDLEEHTDKGLATFRRLIALLGAEHAGLLAELLETIMQDTGYGGVEIVVADRRVQTMKLTKSYQARGKANDR